jgi:rubredoxin
LIEGQSVVSDNEAASVAPQEEFQTWMCLICGWIYDEAAGYPEDGIAPGTRWADVPMNWTCPECGARKEDFEMVSI